MQHAASDSGRVCFTMLSQQRWQGGGGKGVDASNSQLEKNKRREEGKKNKGQRGVGVPPLPNRLPGSCLCYRNDVPSLHGNRPGKVPMRRHVVCCKQARSVRTQKRARYAARKVGDGGRGLPGGACRSAARSFPLHAFVACFRGVLFDHVPRCHLDRGRC